MDLLQQKCVPCEGGIPPMNQNEEERQLTAILGWSINREKIHRIFKTYEFEDFLAAIKFVNKIADLAEAEGHHPNIHINYNKVELELFTHAIKGLSLNDFIVAAKADLIYKELK
jgi:4a-hydroxytetrahydrobiopterin dehydratase